MEFLEFAAFVCRFSFMTPFITIKMEMNLKNYVPTYSCIYKLLINIKYLIQEVNHANKQNCIRYLI